MEIKTEENKTIYWVGLKAFLSKESAEKEMTKHEPKKCSCGKLVTVKWGALCDSCIVTRDEKRFLEREIVKYEGQPVYCDRNDKFFFSSDELNEDMEYNERTESDYRLIPCYEETIRELDLDYYCEVSDEDGELCCKELSEAIDEFNEKIKGLNSGAWSPILGKRIEFTTPTPESRGGNNLK